MPEMPQIKTSEIVRQLRAVDSYEARLAANRLEELDTGWRNLFAAHALNWMAHKNIPVSGARAIAATAFEIADAMMDEAERHPPTRSL